MMLNDSIMNSPLRSSLKMAIALGCMITFTCCAAAQNPPAEAAEAVEDAPEKEAVRPYFNDKKVPDAKDLPAIQELLQKNVVRARAATVCIKLAQGTGSGVIVSEDGLILTAAHVSTGVNKQLTVIMEDGKKYKARSLGLNSDNDAAMIKITEEGTFPYVEIDRNKTADAASTKLGDWVFSLGHSGGFDKARGSGLRLGRLVRIAEYSIQSDCTLIGGDSGGPLFDMNGTLIGIHSRVGNVTEVNLHVPMHVFHTYWDEMLGEKFLGSGKFAKKPIKGDAFIGMSLDEVENGLKVTDLDAESVTGKAGIKIGDIVTAAGGKPVLKKDQLVAIMKDQPAGVDLVLSLIRDGKTIEQKLNLGPR